MIRDLEEVWIVLDALDECTPRNELLSWLSSLAQGFAIQVKMHLMVTSRPEQDIQQAIQSYTRDEQRVAIRYGLLEVDIRNYVQARVREHEGLIPWRGNKEIQNKIETDLIKKADGITESPAENTPKPARNARRDFLTYSERPLRLEEMVDVIAVNVEESVAWGRRFDPEDRLPVPEEITRYCSGLVTLVSRPDSNREEQEVQQIQLAHFSVKEYLTSTRLGSEISQYLSETSASCCIAKVCLIYLLELEQCKTVKEIKKFHFAQYSARYWACHAIVSEYHSDYVFKLAWEVLSNRDLLSSWHRLYDPDKPWLDEPEARSIASALYYGSLLGLSRCVKELLNNGTDVNTKDGYFGNALQAASYRGHQTTVQILVDRGADVNARGGRYDTALHAASFRGYRGILQVLVDHGADVNVQGEYFSTPLYAASSGGYQEIVQLLIDKGADVDAQGGRYDTALQAASCKGYYKIVKTLADRGAYINSRGEFGNALYAASFGGYHETVRILVNCGADVNHQGGYFVYALYAAACKGSRETVNVLIENQADVSAVLDAAFSNGHAEVVKMLLDQGANLNVANKDGWTPLNTASGNGHIKVVKMLLDKGADWAVASKDGWTPLSTASNNGHTEVVKMLLDKGADWAVLSNDAYTPLYSASVCGHLEIVKLLLEKGANVSISTKVRQTAIHAAAFEGHSNVINLLLRHGANKRALDICGRPPLFYAIKAGNSTCFSLLECQEFLEPDFRDAYGSNALSIAVRCGHEEMIRYLLSERSWMVADRFGRAAVWWAHKQGYMQIVEHIAAHPGPAGPLDLPSGSPAKFAVEGDYCDVCLASLEDAYYKCKICCAGSFAMCLGCFDVGARCLADDHHTLTLSDR
ncbi:hypothetical protein G7054_g14184 [Neopestalotiopsis clavispora]|nr:hypothetical protein G7054_g14184 [Neopestalotiopsis clavispora]